MQVVNKKMCVIVILLLVIIESCTLFLMYKSYGNKNNTLDEVNLNINNSNMFAIMLEQEDGTYKEDTTNTWPTSGYTYNESMSVCIDINGNKLDGVLTYDSTNNIATVDTGNTSYCYLYFSIKNNIGSYILNNPTTGLTTTALQGGMYRYQDSVADNYICFGTLDKDECINDTGIYMYRILGITESGQLYLLKKEALDKVYAWHENDSELVSWPESDLFKRLNGTYRNSDGELEPAFVNNGKYPYMVEGNSWYDKIEFHNWKYGNYGNGGYQLTYGYDDNGEYGEFYDFATMNETEQQFTNSIQSKVSLMSHVDNLFTHNSEKSWLGDWASLEDNDSNFPSSETTINFSKYRGSYEEFGPIPGEWGSSYQFDYMYNYDGGENSELVVITDMLYISEYFSGISRFLPISAALTNSLWELYESELQITKVELPVRPVFYLNNDIQYVSGKGTIEDPFIIN